MEKFYRIIFYSVFFFLHSFSSSAQWTRITGRVTDVLTNEPVPFANVSFKNSGIGTTTDINGNYVLETDHPKDSLFVSFIGYFTVGMQVKKGQIQVINFVMKVNRVELKEVVIDAGENPANILFRKIIEHKKQNDNSRLESYQYEIYNKVEFDLTDISEKLKKNKLLKPFAFIWDKIDSTSTNEKPFLPFFITESLSDMYYRREPRAKKEMIKAAKVSGLENPTITQFLGDMYQNIYIYDNFIDVFGKAFISPVSNLGMIYYKYYLLDSAVIGNQWCYKMKFKPRRKQELTFVGEFWVHDTTFAVRKVNMRIVPDANVNFVEDLAIVQDYEYVDRKMWMIAKDMLVVQFSVRQEGMGFIGRKSTSYKSFSINQPIDENTFKGSDNIIVADDAREKDNSFWDEARHDSLNKREKEIYAMVDTIKSLPAFRTYVDIIELFFTGYKDAGMFEIGPYYTMYSFNDVEGNRFRFGGRTSSKFSHRLEFNGYLAYGTKDREFKYRGGMRYIVSEKPREWFGASYKQDILQLGQSDNAFQDDNILSSLFRRSPSNKLTSAVEYRAYFDHEWMPGIVNRITLAHNEYTPLGQLDYSYFIRNENTSLTDTVNKINTSEITLYTRFAYREKFVGGKMDRISLGSKYPTVQANYTIGLKNVLSSNFEYHRVAVKIDDRIKFKPFGYTYYILEGGKVFNTVPYPLLEVHRGNESYVYDYSSFNLMNYYEFVSDAWFSFYATHHFDGFFLDKIPLMRKLKWREVVQFKSIAGSLSKKNREILLNPNAFSSLTKPYIEVGAGVENVLKIIRVDFLWRMSYISKEYLGIFEQRFPGSKKPAEFGVRASLQLIF